MNVNFLQPKEKIAINLEHMYHSFGFEKYKMNKFEKYSFYLENENFLNDSRILTFYDLHGKLLALKPDITMSIIKNRIMSSMDTHKIYYNESVFRIPFGSDEFKEIQQIGVEYFGKKDTYQTIEILNLALRSLKNISDEFILSISNVAILLIFFESLSLKSNQKDKIIYFMQQKNSHDLEKYIKSENIDDNGILVKLLKISSNPKEAIKTIFELFSDSKYLDEIKELEEIVEILLNIVDEKNISIDFSHISNTEYYNQLVFVGYGDGFVNPVLTGGRYDNLAVKMGLDTEYALGFAVDLSVINSSNLDENIKNIEYTKDDNVLNLIAEANNLFDKGEKFSMSKV